MPPKREAKQGREEASGRVERPAENSRTEQNRAEGRGSEASRTKQNRARQKRGPYLLVVRIQCFHLCDTSSILVGDKVEGLYGNKLPPLPSAPLFNIASKAVT